jgi:phosphatidylglycerophosphate synthase
MPLNLPNQITVARLLLAVVFFVVISFYDLKSREDGRVLL